jgi:hypothetical protein
LSIFYLGQTALESADRLRRIASGELHVGESSPLGATPESVHKRIDELSEFAELYETVVDLLCAAAHLGATDVLQKKYEHAAPKAKSAYGRIQPFLVSYLEDDPEDHRWGLTVVGNRVDAFEALFTCGSLLEFLASDDGSMIPRIIRTRQALTLYGEHLSRLAERVS